MRSVRMLVFAAAMTMPALAHAQQPDPQTFRRWDASGGFTIRFGDGDNTVVPGAAWTAEAGRYWTPHLKTSVAVMTTRQSTFEEGPYQAGTYTYNDNVTGPAGYAASLSYEFFDNQFVQPYLLGGLRLASTYTNTTTYLAHAPYSSTIASTPARIEARPVLGGGFKSYFGNGQAFMRTEISVAVNPSGSPHVIVLIGAGVDF
jgi:hypothetical protein